MDFHYHTFIAGKNTNCVSTNDFLTLLKNCTLGSRRPINNMACIEGMIANSDVIVSVWRTKKEETEARELVGIARAVTDFYYTCYLSDLAVHENSQRKGIGKNLIKHLKAAIEPTCKIILIAAPAANAYYEPQGFTHNDRCWVLNGT